MAVVITLLVAVAAAAAVTTINMGATISKAAITVVINNKVETTEIAASRPIRIEADTTTIRIGEDTTNRPDIRIIIVAEVEAAPVVIRLKLIIKSHFTVFFITL